MRFFKFFCFSAIAFGASFVQGALLNVVNTGSPSSNASALGLGKWTLSANPGGYAATPVNVTTLMSAWYVPSASEGKWISIDANQSLNAPSPVYASGDYRYATQFSFGAEAGYALSFDARVFSDNQVKVYLNDVLLTTSGGTDLDGDGLTDNYQVPVLFSLLESQLANGTNTLRFDVTNGPWNGFSNNPTGLLVDFNASYSLIPEPASMLMWSLGGLGTFFVRRRLKK